MGYCLNRLIEPVFMAVSKPLLTEFGIHDRLESCEGFRIYSLKWKMALSLVIEQNIGTVGFGKMYQEKKTISSFSCLKIVCKNSFPRSSHLKCHFGNSKLGHLYGSL